MFEEKTTQQIQRDVTKLIDDMASLRHELGRHGRAKLENLRDEAKDKLGAVKMEAGARAKEVDRYVHEKPWMVAGVAAVLGAVIGTILMRHRRD